MMNRVFGFVILATAVVAFDYSSSRAAELELVPSKSTIEFVGSKPDGTHKGGFKKLDAAAIADFESPANSSISITIDATSLWSDDDKLTNHLKSPDFFDVRNHPKITFTSTEVIHQTNVDGSKKVVIKGDLMMLGKTVATEIPVESTATDDVIEMNAKFVIDRTKWGMTYGQGKVNNDVKLDCKLVFKK